MASQARGEKGHPPSHLLFISHCPLYPSLLAPFGAFQLLPLKLTSNHVKWVCGSNVNFRWFFCDIRHYSRKRDNCECIATQRQSDLAQVSIRFNYDAHAKLEVAQPIRCRLNSVFTADTLRYTVTLSSDPWPWTFVVYWLCRGQSPYQILAKSSNPRQTYWIWIFDLMTLNMYHRVELCSG